jgi:hypothetical protein
MPHVDLIALGLAIGSVSYLVTGASLTYAFRTWVEKKELRNRDKRRWYWLKELTHCPFCVSHWLAFGAVAIYRPWAVDLWRPLDFLVTSFVLVVISMFGVAVIRAAKK